jgi:hypothetical protein
MSAIARLSRGFDRVSMSDGGKLAVSSYTGKSVALVDGPARTATRVNLPLASGEYLAEVQWASAGAVALVMAHGGSQIVVYRLTR